MLESENKSQFFSIKSEKKVDGGDDATYKSLNRIYYFFNSIEWLAER